MNNLYLCGFMGCGKTTIGARLASLLGRKFIDLDALIEKKYNRTILSIFKEFGEDYFRDIEYAELKIIAEQKNVVIAVGGGTFFYEKNILLAKETGKIIYLQLPFEKCYDRICEDKNRPLVLNNSKEELFEIYCNRHTLYKISATYIFEPFASPEFCAKQLAKIERKK